MKDNLENAFKNSLDQYEVSYDPKAWDAVNTKLNANAAAGNSALSSALKWVLASVLLGTVVTGSYFLWYNEDNSATQQTAAIENDNAAENSANKEQANNNEEILVSENSEEVSEHNLKENSNITVPIVSETEKQAPNKKDVKEVEKVEKVKSDENEIIKGTKSNAVIPNKEVFISANFVSGKLSANAICLGEVIEINNSSKNDKVRFQINGEWINLNSGKSYLFKPRASSIIRFVDDNNVLIESKFFTVNELPTPDFNFEANIYEKGMPVVIAEAFGDFVNYSWEFNKETERSGAIVRHHFFDKGDYEVTLNVKDMNGCEASIAKTVRIRDKFNLMAVDAFKPNGSDVRNRTFMPYSLTEREVSFQLTIVDPIDNGVVFTSSDAETTWDGTDQRTGKLSPSNKAFIWKVQIFNPAPNERPIYAGTVVHN
ncbi:PKD domain-containing protein [Brumimicrobium glaciale]|uniref:PKD domain-containing protein n=1 Tax=Brumimicrobium glaciale TaxID=200475 RepID=A0A4Q4KJI5_9FLAO|nr:PKD domain-containing protein [Brumimicrobium glaciale]RYM33355.1 PKD domain-containing protein [Brumimicrobium glaciale]